LARAAQGGVAIAAKDLGLRESQIYAWRAKARLEGQTTEERCLLQSAEQARLRREVARLEEEDAFPKSRRCTSRSSRSEVRGDEGTRGRVRGAVDVPGAVDIA
jgi:transposase-like protein